MIRSTLILVTMTFASAGCGTNTKPASDAPTPENTQVASDIYGKWLVTEIVYWGKPLPDAEVRSKRSIWNFEDATMENTRANGPSSKGKWTRDTTANPKRLEIVIDGSTMKCIYSLEQKRLKICIAGKSTDDYPTKFESTENPPTELLTLERQ